MLGIAGAYLLRAIAESSTFPRSAVVAIAIAYTAMWLVAATRVKTEARFASIAYAGTSVLILVPMLWELTLRFSVFPAAMAASVLAAFVVASFFLAWKHHFATVIWVTTAIGSTAALIMAVATHDLVPFIIAILVMAIATEYAAAHNRNSAIRLWVAASADIAVCALIYIASRPSDSRLDYKQVSEWLLLTLGPILLLLYGASATAQTMLRSRRITLFEASQTLVAFLMAVWSVLAFGSSAGAIVLGSLCLMSSAFGYALAFARFGATTEQRNFHVYAAGCAALFLVGVAPATILVGSRSRRRCNCDNHSRGSNRTSYPGVSRAGISLGRSALIWTAALYRSRFRRHRSRISHVVDLDCCCRGPCELRP
jgi:hypothetical protein